jgi:hypothetical protein
MGDSSLTFIPALLVLLFLGGYSVIKDYNKLAFDYICKCGTEEKKFRLATLTIIIPPTCEFGSTPLKSTDGCRSNSIPAFIRFLHITADLYVVISTCLLHNAVNPRQSEFRFFVFRTNPGSTFKIEFKWYCLNKFEILQPPLNVQSQISDKS